MSVVTRQDRGVRASGGWQGVGGGEEERVMLARVFAGRHRAPDHPGPGDQGHHVLVQTLDRHGPVQTGFH